jgi:hypothetical protein
VTDDKGPGGRDDAEPLNEIDSNSASITKIVQVPQQRRNKTGVIGMAERQYRLVALCRGEHDRALPQIRRCN